MPPDQSDLPTWYVALVHGGMERIAEAHLLNVGFAEAFYPKQVHKVLVRGRTVESLRAVYSGYVLCSVHDFTPELWHRVRPESDEFFVPTTEAPGHRLVHGLIRGFAGGWRDDKPPDPVPAERVEWQRSRCDADGVWTAVEPPPPMLHQPGTLVHVKDDAWTGHVFRVVWDDGRGVNIRALQGVGFTLYIPRERVEVVIKNENVVPLQRERPMKRMHRGYRAKRPQAGTA